MKDKISNLEDRALMELILSNQVAMMQWLDRLNSFYLEVHGKDYKKYNKQKGEIFNDFLLNQNDLLMQISDND